MIGPEFDKGNAILTRHVGNVTAALRAELLYSQRTVSYMRNLISEREYYGSRFLIGKFLDPSKCPPEYKGTTMAFSQCLSVGNELEPSFSTLEATAITRESMKFFELREGGVISILFSIGRRVICQPQRTFTFGDFLDEYRNLTYELGVDESGSKKATLEELIMGIFTGKVFF